MLLMMMTFITGDGSEEINNELCGHDEGEDAMFFYEGMF